MKKFLFIVLAAGFSLPSLSQLSKTPANAKPKSGEQAVIEFCMKNRDPYQLIKKWLKDNKGKNTTVTPLAMDASCNDCHDPSQYAKDTAVINRWIGQSNKPESDYVNTLLKMEREWQLLGGGGDKISSDLPDCFYEFSKEDFSDMVLRLETRIYDRVVDMAQKNKKKPQYAFPGITYLLAITREMTLLGAFDGNDNSSVSLAGEWLQSCYDQFGKRLFKEYQYQLYPTYLALIRNLALAGSGQNFGDIVEWMKKMNDFMHFKLKVSFEASGHGDNGGKYHALVNGETEIQCSLKEGGCYEWEPVNGNTMDFTVTEVMFVSDQGSAVYKGPQTFSTPVNLKVNMCADNPTLKISFNTFGAPDETYVTNDGATFQSPLLYSLAMATLGSVNMNKMQSQADQWKAKADQFKGHEAEIDAAAKRLNDHKNDPAYMQSAQGKADMARMNQMARSMGYDPSSIRPDPKQMKNLDNLHAYTDALKKQEAKMTKPGYLGSEEYYKDQQEINSLKAKTDLNSITSKVGLDINMLQVEAPFQIGIKQPVDKIQKDKIKEIANSAEGWEFGEFHVTLENISQ